MQTTPRVSLPLEAPALPAPNAAPPHVRLARAVSDTETFRGVPREQLRLDVVTGRAELEALWGPWQSLAAAAVEPNPFYEPWMVLPALDAFETKSEPVQFVVVSAPAPTGGTAPRVLCGLFPVQRRRAAGVPLRMLGLWKHPYAYLTAPLLRAEGLRDTVSLFLDWIAAQQDGLLRMEGVPGDGPFRQALVDELRERGWSSYLGEAYTRAVFRPASSASEFLARSLSGRRQRDLRVKQKGLGSHGEVSFAELGPTDEIDPWVKDFIQLEAMGWKGREAVAVACQQAHRQFLETISENAHARSRLALLALKVDGKPVAMKYSLLSAPGSFAFKITYDERFARYSPGVLLELQNITWLQDRPHIRWMDSCSAPDRRLFNQLWPDRREIHTLFIATRAPLPSLVLAGLPLARWVRNTARQVLASRAPQG